MSSKRVAPPPRGKVAVRSDFRVGEFEVAIEQQGYRILWEHASICACRSNRHGGQPNYSCPVCHGEGYDYHSSQEIKAIVDRSKGDQRVLSPEGNYHKFHSAEFTVLAQHRPSFYHRYTLLDSVMEHSELAKAKRGIPVILSHPIASGDLRVVETGLTGASSVNEASFDVLRIRVMNPATLCPDRVLLRGVDYFVTHNSETDELDLLIGDDVFNDMSSEEVYFSISYYINPRFVVMDFVYSIRDTFVKFKKPTATYEAMPVTVTAQLDIDNSRLRSNGGIEQGDY